MGLGTIDMLSDKDYEQQCAASRSEKVEQLAAERADAASRLKKASGGARELLGRPRPAGRAKQAVDQIRWLWLANPATLDGGERNALEFAAYIAHHAVLRPELPVLADVPKHLGAPISYELPVGLIERAFEERTREPDWSGLRTSKRVDALIRAGLQALGMDAVRARNLVGRD